MEIHHLRNVCKPCQLKIINKAPKCPLQKFSEWFRGQTEFTTPYEEMNPEKLNKCLQKFYVAARKKGGNYYNRKSLTAIRAAIDSHLRSPPLSKPFSIVADSQFKEANKTLSNFLKNLSKNGEISGTKHKGAVTREVVQKLYEKNELVGVNSLHPLKLMQTVWFYVTLFLGKRGRENQAKKKKNFLVLRQDANGEKYFEINRERGAGVLTSKNHQGGLADSEDHSDGKIFARPGSSRCPVETIQSYLSHLNRNAVAFFKKHETSAKNLIQLSIQSGMPPVLSATTP